MQLFMQARLMRDFAEVERIGATILQSNKDGAFVHRAMARQFGELGQSASARPHWNALHEQDPKNFEAAFHVAQALHGDGASLNDAVAVVSARAPGKSRVTLPR